MAEYLFVYGTLIKGERNNSLLKGCTLTEYTYVPGLLYDTGNGYPAAVHDSGMGSRIYGELYRLPDNKGEILRELDGYEAVEEGLFKREQIHIGNSRSYIYTIGKDLQDSPYIQIPGGSWLNYSRRIKDDPVGFALNFEKVHKNYYRYDKEESIIHIPGENGVLLSSPHATNHIRLSKLKRYEICTAAINVLMHARLNTSSIYTNSVSEIDPNFYDDCRYKHLLYEYSKNNEFIFVLDIHGTGEERGSDIYPGIGNGGEFLLGENYILDQFYSSADKHSLNCGSLKTFPAARQSTVTKYCARTLGIPSMQIEINRKFRQPDVNRENFEKLIRFLEDFITGIKKRNE